jgi:hypothetical protein
LTANDSNNAILIAVGITTRPVNCAFVEALSGLNCSDGPAGRVKTPPSSRSSSLQITVDSCNCGQIVGNMWAALNYNRIDPEREVCSPSGAPHAGCRHRALPGAAGLVGLVGVVGLVGLTGLVGRTGLVGLVGLVGPVGLVGVGLARPGPSPHQSATSFGYCSSGGGQRCPGGKLAPALSRSQGT